MMKLGQFKALSIITRVVIMFLTILLFTSTVTVEASASDITLIGQETLSDRLYELTFQTSALANQTKVRILLPAGYESNPTKRYPVLYLLHGAGIPGIVGEESLGYMSWTYAMNAEQETEAYEMIVVMPDGGQGGFYSDWYNNGSEGQPKWETYHIKQLIPWIDSNYRTVASRDGRAIAGLSMGGFGAVSYAARYPDLFCAVASYSGYLDILADPDLATLASMYDGGVEGSIWGTRELQMVRWRGHNPEDLAENLRGMTIMLYTGNGYDSSGNLVDPIEQMCEQAAIRLHNKLESLGIAHIWENYGPGLHDCYYWQRSLRQTLPVFDEVFDQSVQPPETFAYNTIKPAYKVFDWDVSIARSALEFSRFEVTNNGFKLKGSGLASVKTAPKYMAGELYTVNITGPNQNQILTLQAGPDKCLTIPILLGPPNLYQQYTGHESEFYTNTVTISEYR